MHWERETIALHAGQEPDIATRSRAVPIYQTTSYLFENAEDAASLFGLKPEVWAPRLNLRQDDLQPSNFPMHKTGNIYTRIMNPTSDVLEKRLAALEGGIGALVTSSGSSATSFAIMNICRTGDHVVAASSLYGGTYNLLLHTLPQYGIKTSFVNGSNPEEFAQAITEHTKCLFVETIGNPSLDVPDFERISQIAHKAKIPLIVDNTVASPHLCRPFEYGADIVVHSLTKFCGGHGTTIGGGIVDSGNFDWESSGKFPMFSVPDPSYNNIVWNKAVGPGAYIIRIRTNLMRDIGACLSPLNSFLLLQGIETLPLRMERHCSNAMAVANFLKNHHEVSWVRYPGLKSHPSHLQAKRYLQNGFGAIVGFGIKGGLDAGKDFINRLKLFSHLANIGDAKSLAIHPASTTHVQLTSEEQTAAGVGSDFVRLSIGIEHINDLLRDLDQALKPEEKISCNSKTSGCFSSPFWP